MQKKNAELGDRTAAYPAASASPGKKERPFDRTDGGAAGRCFWEKDGNGHTGDLPASS